MDNLEVRARTLGKARWIFVFLGFAIYSVIDGKWYAALFWFVLALVVFSSVSAGPEK